jgi:hypothetical protein
MKTKDAVFSFLVQNYLVSTFSFDLASLASWANRKQLKKCLPLRSLFLNILASKEVVFKMLLLLLHVLINVASFATV